jgi:hypothetical protein
VTTSRCIRCGEREAWAAVFAVPALQDHDGVLSPGAPAERLCRECYHTEHRELAVESRREQSDHLAHLGPEALDEIAQHLATAVRDASDEEWRKIVAALREAEQLRGRPWPPAIHRYLLDDARGDPEASA